jgi:hypothetical protein
VNIPKKLVILFGSGLLLFLLAGSFTYYRIHADDPSCDSPFTKTTLLDTIYEQATIAAKQAITMPDGEIYNGPRSSIEKEIGILRKKPLLVVDQVFSGPVVNGAITCTAFVSYHTGKNLRDPRQGLADGVLPKGFNSDIPDGLLLGKAPPENIQLAIYWDRTQKKGFMTVSSGLDKPVAAAGMLALNRYSDKLMSDIIPIGTYAGQTTD